MNKILNYHYLLLAFTAFLCADSLYADTAYSESNVRYDLSYFYGENKSCISLGTYLPEGGGIDYFKCKGEEFVDIRVFEVYMSKYDQYLFINGQKVKILSSKYDTEQRLSNAAKKYVINLLRSEETIIFENTFGKKIVINAKGFNNTLKEMERKASAQAL